MDSPSKRRFAVEEVASNLAAWHDSSVRALGRTASRGPCSWRHEPPCAEIYFAWMALRGPEHAPRHLDDVLAAAERWGSTPFHACDTWSQLELDAHGFELVQERTWSWRPSLAQVPAHDAPSELVVSRVTSADELREWEHRSAWAFGDRPPDPWTPGAYHAPEILEDERMHVLAGKRDGEIVSGVMAYRGRASVGTYALFTLPEHRQQGYGRTTCLAAASLFPSLPVTSEPSASSSGVHHALGFEDVGRYRIWRRA